MHWLVDIARGKGYEIHGSAKPSHGAKLRPAIDTIVGTATPAAAAGLPQDPHRREPQREAYSGEPDVVDLVVEALPAQVRAGEQVDLALRYDVLGPSADALEVLQSWTLTLGDEALPSYPNQNHAWRRPGTHEAALEQVIPLDAPIGIYKLKGEVCVNDGCRSRTTTFEVIP